MFSLWDNVDPDKRDVSVVGMKKLLDQLGSVIPPFTDGSQKKTLHYKVKGSKKLLFNWDKVQEWLEGQSGIPQKTHEIPLKSSFFSSFGRLFSHLKVPYSTDFIQEGVNFRD